MRIIYLLLFSFQCFFSQSQDRALFFAVNEYEHKELKSLKHPINDARDIAGKLHSLYGFDTLVIENPTLEEMAQVLNELRKSYHNKNEDRSDRLLLFFSGHGVSEDKNGYFLPMNANPNSLFNTGFAYSIWRPFIDHINCKHILVAIDACFSGTFDPSWWAGKRDYSSRPGELSEGALLIANHALHTTRYFFTSATEKATPDKSKFAKKFKEALSGKGGKDGILTSTELFTFLEVANPIPHRGEFGSDEPESSFLFITANQEINEGTAFNVSKAEQKAWDDALKENTISAYEAYKQAYPKGNFTLMANNIIEKINAWSATNRYTYVVDKDRNAYPVLKMKDGKNWMVKNLNVKTAKSLCYANLPQNCEKYGRLYTWEAAKEGCRKLGNGWHLPTDEEWRNMGKEYVGGYEKNGNDGEAAFQALFGDGSSGFAALLGGVRDSGGSFQYLGAIGYYWSATETGGGLAYLYEFSGGDQRLDRYYLDQGFGFSVRCLQSAR